MIKYMKGDLILLAKHNWFDAIAHGCNCFNTMNSGVAKNIREAFPVVYEVDSKTERGDRTKLGTFTEAKVLTLYGNEISVFNLYTQYRYGTDRPHFDYNALDTVLARLADQYPGIKLGLPKIGSGLAGGDWSRIEAILNNYSDKLQITVVEYDSRVPIPSPVNN